MAGPPRRRLGRLVPLLRLADLFASTHALRWSLLLLIALICGTAHAGRYDRQSLAKLLPPPLQVGEKESKVPAWPIYLSPGIHPAIVPADDAIAWPTTIVPPGKPLLVGYVFESADISPLPGFVGKPIELLVAIDANGQFVDVRVIDHKEPLFHHGLPPQSMENFARKLRGLGVRDRIQIVAPTGVSPIGGGDTKLLSGVTGGTVSIRVLQRSVMTAAIRVARIGLGLAVGADYERMARVKLDHWIASDWDGLMRAGLLQRFAFTRGQTEQAFAGTGLEAPAGSYDSNEIAIELFVAPGTMDQVARNLFDSSAYQQVQQLYQATHQQTLMVIARGPERIVSPNDLRGGVPERLVLRQGELALELRDFAYYGSIDLPPGFEHSDARLIKITNTDDFDPGVPLNLALRLSRQRSFPNRPTVREFPFALTIPEAFLVRPPKPEPPWQAVWRDRQVDLAVLAGGLLVLAGALFGQHALAARTRTLRTFRIGFLMFTLGFIGWHGQGQLSIVNITALIEALRSHASLDFFLLDPMSLMIWAFVALSFLIWGRGTFCGWLCPFGALQELLSRITQKLGIAPRRVPLWLDAKLKWLKYVVLAVIVGSIFIDGNFTDRLVEVEPFKTAISLYFVRAWPYLAWALATLSLSVFVFRGFCRYLCPLGAAAALLGSLRRWNWIARRIECGTPCQTCRYRCEYQAIAVSGKVHYSECFQCLDCVAIHESDKLCAPRVLAKRKPNRTIAIRPIAIAPAK